MKLEDIKKEIQKYQYFEDTNIIDVSLASIIATRLKLGDPIWLILIGPSSGGKSQILRPLALTDERFIHRVDDVTENTFLSGMSGGDVSLLTRIGSQGLIVISDFTVLFSKAKEARASILSQFRMIYDGEMIKYAGNKAKPLHWKGYLGVLAGSTPSIYSHFEEVADMGERFIYYRMKEYDAEKATKLSMDRNLYGKKLDETLSDLYREYIKEVVTGYSSEVIVLPTEFQNRILKIALFAEKIRTTAHFDYKDRTLITKVPIPAMPMRVALQLTAVGKGLFAMRKHENSILSENDMRMIEWCGYSLANEEKRACLRVLAQYDFGVEGSTQSIADLIGLSTSVINSVLQNLASVGVLKRTGGSGDKGGLHWKFSNQNEWELVRKIENISGNVIKHFESRELTEEEPDELNEALNASFDNF